MKNPFPLTREGSWIINIYYNNSPLKGQSPCSSVEHPIARRRGAPSVRAGEPRLPKREGASFQSPKREVAINPINSRRTGNARYSPGHRIEHISLNSHPICAKISGIARPYDSPSASIFFGFFRTFFWSHFSNWTIN